jgi:phosphatidylserine decarboxylase
MFTFFVHNLLWSEGLEIFLFLALIFVCGLFLFRPLAYVSMVAFFGCLFFFRNPERVCEPALHDKNVLICPADGVVVAVQSASGHENSVLKNADAYTHTVAIFLSVRDVHVNWIPMSGIVEKVVHTPGTFLVASTPESSRSNERNEITITDRSGRHVCVRQIAGKIARRVRCWVRDGQEVAAGQKFGMIKFGSRVEVLVPASVEIAVAVGQKVYGGHTVLGYWCDTNPAE